MKKCPECGNPSYDGAPVCGNCGFQFPKQKVTISKGGDIFQNNQKKQKKQTKQKTSKDESVIDILKEKKLIIGIILLLTLLVICGIVLTGSNNKSTSIQSIDSNQYDESGFSFKYPKNWEELNITDENHTDAKFFKNGENTVIEFYNVSTDYDSLKQITQERISYAQGTGSYVELVETIVLDGRNSSNIILENADGDYTRFVSMFSNGELYVFKITGDSINSVTSGDVQSMIGSADIA